MSFERPIRIFASVLIAFFVTGCAGLGTGAQYPVDRPVDTPAKKGSFEKTAEEVAALLAYYQRLLDLSPEEQKREYQQAVQAYAKEKTETARFRYALSLCIPNAPWRDDVRLLQLLEPVQGGTVGESPRRHLAALIVKLISDRGREIKRIESLYKDEQKRADDLQQKLDAVLDIERDLRQRSNRPVGSK